VNAADGKGAHWLRPALALLAGSVLLYGIGRLVLAGFHGRTDVEPDRMVWLGLLGFWLLLAGACMKRLRPPPEEEPGYKGTAARDQVDRAVTIVLALFFLGTLVFLLLR
jgi:hypothetical protein